MTNQDRIINNLINKLKQNEIWFTTKKDITYEEPAGYYELDEYGDLTEKSKRQIVEEINNYVGDGAVDLVDAINLWMEESMNTYKISYISCLRTKYKAKPVVDQIEAYTNDNTNKHLQESYSNNRKVIEDKMLSEDFDIESKDGQITKKTSDLFDLLSDKGFKVDVSFDNGEGECSIALGEQGGKVIITITDAEAPVKAFANGSFQLTEANIEILDNIKDIINSNL